MNRRDLTLLRLRAMLGETFDTKAFRALLWAEFDAWQEARMRAEWAEYVRPKADASGPQPDQP